MGKRSGKRKRSEFKSDLKEQDDSNQPDSHNTSKKSRKNDTPITSKNDYPSLFHPELHKLQSSITINDLQCLILHCLADGKNSRWVTVKNAQKVKKAVVLFVPGLEKGMFDGSIKLNEQEINGKCSGQTMESRDETDQKIYTISPLNVASLVANGETEIKIARDSPDYFMPVRLDIEKLPTPLKPLAAMFEYQWPVKASADDRYCKIHSPMHTLLTAPITKLEESKKQKYEVLTKAKSTKVGKPETYKRASITEFIASAEELKDNDFTIHPVYLTTPDLKEQEAIRRMNSIKTSDGGTEAGWIDTPVTNLEEGEVPAMEIEAGSVTAGRHILAIDCEMCRVVGGELALTRISVVDWEGKIVLDELAKPYKEIIDYLTPYSGMTPAKLNPVENTLKSIQNRLVPLLTPQTIIIGHSLNADLQALQITHPFVIDTSILYPHPRGPPLKSSLKWLAQKYLNREIQKGDGSSGHDSIEDARTCLDLVKLKCERGSAWGVSEPFGESIYKRLLRTPRSGNYDSLSAGAREGKTGAMIDYGTPEKKFGPLASFCIDCADDNEVVQGVKRTVLGDPDGVLVPGGGVDFTWARFRELENLRGWSNESKPLQNPSEPETPAPMIPPSPSVLSATVTQTVQHIKTIYDFLPPCTLLVVYSGTGNMQELRRLQALHRTFKDEFRYKKWDELSVQWTDKEEQEMRMACKAARMGVGFVGIK